MSSRSRWDAGSVMSIAALLWTIGAGIAFLVVPTYSTVSSDSSVSQGTSSSASNSEGIRPETTEVTTTSRQTMLEAEGAGVLILLLIPVVVALVGALGGGRRKKGIRLGAGITLTAACLLAAMSLGLFYLPAALLLLASAIWTPVQRAPRGPIPL